MQVRIVEVGRDVRRSLSGYSRHAKLEALAFGVPLVIAAVMGYRQRWVAEDAFITLRVVDNLLAGHGPVFNIGERVEVYTHPLWLLIITLAGALGADPAQAAAHVGLAASIAGIALAQLGAARLWRCAAPRSRPQRTFVVPAGAVAFVSIAVVWDFLTSGLETGLTFLWLGLSFWLLVRRVDRAVNERGAWTPPFVEALVFGLGPLVRPDLGLFSLAFLGALVFGETRRPSRRRAIAAAAWSVVSFGIVPCVYQVFRMGYFASLVPNTALAKEASSFHWERGWAYLTDFTGTYVLWIPLGIALVGWLLLLSRARIRGPVVVLVAVCAPLAAALHGLYVIAIGGDFMHGRLLLPALFGLLLPVAAVPVQLPGRASLRAALEWGALGVVGIWALVCALFLRWPFDDAAIRGDVPQGIIDERRFFVEQTGNAHPMAVEDYRGTAFGWVEHGTEMRALAATYPRLVLTNYGPHQLDEDVDRHIALVIYAQSIGVMSHATGDQIRLVDTHGLGDPLAGRMKAVESERPGHQKSLPEVWIHARYADLNALGPLPADVQAAADVLRCGDVAELIEAVEAPMTVSRFVENFGLSWKLTELRIDPDPFVARAELCQPRP